MGAAPVEGEAPVAPRSYGSEREGRPVKKALILGGGMVGSAMAMDLAQQPGVAVTVADVRPAALERVRARYGVAVVQADLSDPAAVRSLCAGYDVVLGALSSVIGFQTLRAVIEAGTDYCDISFMPEDAVELDALARGRGVTAVVDCGVAPGMSNMMAGYAASRIETCQSIEIYVGGLPVVRSWPYEYKAGFSPHDVIEEYVRPSRIVEGGRVVVREALSEPELLELARIGTLEAFNTDGLRSLATTLNVPFMKEKTLRYPGHVALVRALRDTGFFSKEPVEIGGHLVRPLDVTAKLLFPKWTYGEGEADLTVMRVTASGTEGGRAITLGWDLYDEYDPATDTRSMSRTTAFPATIVARMLLDGRYRKPGVHPPEHLGREAGVLEHVLAELAKRGVEYVARHA
jgi:saccharopine dehydrogenase-like NADP-dependent oxidoreductase